MSRLSVAAEMTQELYDAPHRRTVLPRDGDYPVYGGDFAPGLPHGCSRAPVQPVSDHPPQPGAFCCDRRWPESACCLVRVEFMRVFPTGLLPRPCVGILWTAPAVCWGATLIFGVRVRSASGRPFPLQLLAAQSPPEIAVSTLFPLTQIKSHSQSALGDWSPPKGCFFCCPPEVQNKSQG